MTSIPKIPEQAALDRAEAVVAASEKGGAWTAGVLGVMWTLMPPALGLLILAYIGAASDYLVGLGGIGLLFYIAAFAVLAGCGLLPTYAQAILGGWVFGFTYGIMGALLGFAGGAVIGYAITRIVARDRVEHLIDRHPRAMVIRDALIGHGFLPTVGVVSLLRLPPNSPFALTNLAMASTGVPFTPYVFGTVIGMAPRTALAVALAASAASTGARDIQGLIGEKGLLPMIIGIAVFIVVAATIGFIAKRAVDRMPAANGAAKSTAAAVPDDHGDSPDAEPIRNAES